MAREYKHVVLFFIIFLIRENKNLPENRDSKGTLLRLEQTPSTTGLEKV